MFAKLLSLLLHAKSGAISAVFLLGATGALVSVSTSNNGVTTITITEPSASPSASASASVSETTHTATARPSESPDESSSPSSSSPSPACTDEAKALALQVQRVNTAFSGFHTDLMKLRGQRAVATVETADVLLKRIRQAAVKAIDATATLSCKKSDGEDKATQAENQTENDTNDTDNGEDTTVAAAPTTTTSLSGDRKNDEQNNNSDHAKTKPAPITFTGDAASIADQAIAAMQVAFDTVKNAPASTPKPTHSPEPTHSPKVTSPHGTDTYQQKGEHHD